MERKHGKVQHWRRPTSESFLCVLSISHIVHDTCTVLPGPYRIRKILREYLRCCNLYAHEHSGHHLRACGTWISENEICRCDFWLDGVFSWMNRVQVRNQRGVGMHGSRDVVIRMEEWMHGQKVRKGWQIENLFPQQIELRLREWPYVVIDGLHFLQVSWSKFL
jgi:hypothetical protein